MGCATLEPRVRQRVPLPARRHRRAGGGQRRPGQGRGAAGSHAQDGSSACTGACAFRWRTNHPRCARAALLHFVALLPALYCLFKCGTLAQSSCRRCLCLLLAVHMRAAVGCYHSPGFASVTCVKAENIRCLNGPLIPIWCAEPGVRIVSLLLLQLVSLNSIFANVQGLAFVTRKKKGFLLGRTTERVVLIGKASAAHLMCTTCMCTACCVTACCFAARCGMAALWHAAVAFQAPAACPHVIGMPAACCLPVVLTWRHFGRFHFCTLLRLCPFRLWGRTARWCGPAPSS